MATTTAADTADERPEATWYRAEQDVIERVGSLSRWDAERWAAAHERRNPPPSLIALRAALMQVALNTKRADYLDAAFKRIGRAVAKNDWADHRAAADQATPALCGDVKEAVRETAAAVAEMAQHALAATVLVDVVADQVSPRRWQQLVLAQEAVSSPTSSRASATG